MSGSHFYAVKSLVLFAAPLIIAAAIGGCGGDNGSVPASTIEQNFIVAADFNVDGRLDLAVATGIRSGEVAGSGRVEVFPQDPVLPGSFPRSFSFTVGIDPFHLAADDLNGDGLPDIATANAGSDTISVLLNNPSQPGTFFSAVGYPCGPAPFSVATGDLDGDGLADIVDAVADGADILFQNPAAPGTFFAPVVLPLTGGTFSVAIGDVDGDGIADIVVSGIDAIYVFFQDPLIPGSFFLPERFAAGLNPNGVVISDIDQDGLLDIAVANLGSEVDGSGSSFSILIQDPAVAGNFLSTRNFSTPAGAQNLAAADLDGDGFPDIAVASVVLSSPDPGIISVYFQSVTPGNFVSGGTLADGFTPLSVAIGDLNVDGAPDIAVQDGPAIFFQDPLRRGMFFNEVVIGP